MKYNENYAKVLEEDICCCIDKCKCNKPKEDTISCSNQAKKDWEEYLEKEKCKPEPEVTFNICEYDPSEVYFLQYLSKRTLANQEFTRNGIKPKGTQ